MAMGEMRRGVAVPSQASIGDGGGHGVHGVGQAVVSLQGLWSVMQRRGVAVPRQASISDWGRHSVDGVGRAVVSLQGLWAVCYLCVR